MTRPRGGRLSGGAVAGPGGVPGSLSAQVRRGPFTNRISFGHVSDPGRIWSGFGAGLRICSGFVVDFGWIWGCLVDSGQIWSGFGADLERLWSGLGAAWGSALYNDSIIELYMFMM